MDSNTDLTNRMGTLVQQTGFTREINPNEGVNTSMKLARSHLGEDSFTLQTLVAKEQTVANMLWMASGQPAGYNLAMFTVPDDLITSNATSGPFLLATYARLGARVRVQVSGMPMCQGALIVWYAPYTSQNAIYPTTLDATQQTGYGNVTSLTGFQCGILQANNADSVEIVINWRQIRDYLRLNNADTTDFIGTLGISVFSPLQGASTPSLAVNVFSQFVDAGYYIPSPLGVTFSEVYSGQPGPKLHKFRPRKSILRRIQRMFRDDVEEVEGEIQASVALAAVAGGMLTKMMNKMLPKEMQSDGLGGSMDKPAETRTEPIIVRRAYSYLGHGEGTDVVDRHDLVPSSQAICLPEHFGSDVDEMDVGRVCSRPMLHEVCNWTTSNNNNDILMQGLVCPCDQLIRSDSTFGPYPMVVFSTYSPTYLDYMSQPHSFWRGEIIYKVQVFSSKFHAGKLLFAFHPQEGTVPTSYSESSGQYCLSMDLSSGVNTWTFSTPFKAATPYLKVPNGHNLQSDTNAYDYITGSWSLRVQNKLVANAAVANNVDVYIWKYAGKDWELVGLCGNNISLTPVKDVAWSQPVIIKKEIVEGEMQAATGQDADGASTSSPPELSVTDKKITMEETSGESDKPATSEVAVFNSETKLKIAASDTLTYGDWQFGVSRKYMNMRTGMKRYVQVWSGSMCQVANWAPNTIDGILTIEGGIRVTPMREAMGDDMVGFTTTTGTAARAGQFPAQGGYSKGYISHCSDIFRFWRGSTNFKLQWASYNYNPRKFWMIYLPNQITRSYKQLFTPSAGPVATTPANTSQIPQNIEEFLFQILGTYGVIPNQVPNFTKNAIPQLQQASVHVSWAASEAGELSMQCPFFTHTNVRICGFDTACQQNAPTTLGTSQQMPVGLNNACGTLWFGTYSYQGANISGNQAQFCNLYQSVGDDFAMGGLLPPPPLIGVNGETNTAVSPVGFGTFLPIYPDTYSPTTGLPWAAL